MTHDAQTFLEHTTLRQLINVPSALLAACATRAFEHLASGDFDGAEVLARGLIAADHQHWYHHALLVITLQKRGRLREATTHLEEALRHLPAHPELEALGASLRNRRPPGREQNRSFAARSDGARRVWSDPTKTGEQTGEQTC
jgi:Flp pilus assembly protein TadD